MDDWEAVRSEIARLITTSEEDPSSEIAVSAADLISLATARFRVPTSIGFGYWPTIRMSWSSAGSAPTEIEIAGDRFEYYAFSNGRTDIRHFPHSPGAPVDETLVQLLEKAIGRH